MAVSLRVNGGAVHRVGIPVLQGRSLRRAEYDTWWSVERRIKPDGTQQGAYPAPCFAPRSVRTGAWPEWK